MLRKGVLLAGGLVFIACISMRLTIVMLVSVPVLTIIAHMFGKLIRRISWDVQDRLADSNVIVEETLQNIASVKAFANETYEEGRYRSALDVYLKAALRGAFYEGAFISFIVFVLFGSIVLVLWYGARMVLADDLSAGELTRFMLYTMYVGGAAGSFADLYSQFQRMLGASQRVRELLRETPEAGAPPEPIGSLKATETVKSSVLWLVPRLLTTWLEGGVRSTRTVKNASAYESIKMARVRST